MAETQLNHLTLTFLVETALKNAVSGFLVDREVSGARPATLNYYRVELDLFTRWAGEVGANDLEDLTPAVLRQYFLTLGERRNESGVHCAFRAIRAWLRWAWVEFDIDSVNPIGKVKVAAPSRDPKEGISLTDVKKLLSACEDKRDKAIVLVLLDTGIRRRELLSLDIGDLDGESLHLRPDGTKSGKARTVFLSRESARALTAYLRRRKDTARTAPLFATQDGGRFTAPGLRQVIRRLCEKAGIQETGLHAFRRTFALESLRAGGDLISVSRLLGHSSLEVTKVYLAQVTNDLAEVHLRTSPVSKMLSKGRK